MFLSVCELAQRHHDLEAKWDAAIEAGDDTAAIDADLRAIEDQLLTVNVETIADAKALIGIAREWVEEEPSLNANLIADALRSIHDGLDRIGRQ